LDGQARTATLSVDPKTFHADQAISALADAGFSGSTVR
jgi:hypothetical protein